MTTNHGHDLVDLGGTLRRTRCKQYVSIMDPDARVRARARRAQGRDHAVGVVLVPGGRSAVAARRRGEEGLQAMMIEINDDPNALVLLVTSGATTVISGWVQNQSPKTSVFGLDCSHIHLPGGGLPREVHAEHCPGPFLDKVVRMLGYEARRRRVRKVAK